MLKNFFVTFNFLRFCQSGFYFDFFYKKVADVFVRNVLIYGAQFFGEKYLIEYLTKNITDKIIFNSNKFIGWNKLMYSWFFAQIITFVFYFIILLNCIYLIF